MRIYYCSKCSRKTEVPKNVVKQCKCGNVFGVSSKISDHINMRTTLSGTTKMEFTQTTMDADIAERNRR
jgi:uncharacterized Zn finger protein|tara:strand:+ start:607 stop:813 length:207 start_codon:yes stop_codon:yes gene_type:complete